MYKVRIDKFEGPFDLLVYLLENARMDIYDIRVSEITEQYIGYLKEMEELNVEVDTEFIVLAAVLIRLKSRAAGTTDRICPDQEDRRNAR